ncbi:hypothetical protein PUNSTDRAFT_131754 [Punctularia strigosozonata HHB-11173 SS5]|uniref:uncharacterized protein n=1 Tax=Punctularia strigosozonata (strain HHB-11173) TaxID=741275 RepID=UPI00044167D4|nr:uncharacterized protein PUNSTDRAFT_131754 [Punctularia strigosozonata HHB-11173 SS5]EIN11594.1 hypothetical protein PUNSTDRAFT_131754 [Punctularia strigosozonata HHB-11173 SS5]
MSPTPSPDIGEKSTDNSGVTAPFHASTPGTKLQNYPASLFVFVFWLGYIAAMIWLLNDVARRSATSAEDSLFEKKDILAQIMSVFFAQAHVPITAMHLGRLAISSLQNPDTAPHTWTELFWLADRSWQGPIAIGGTYFTMAKRHMRPSATFFLFSLACLSAAVTPILISRAWPTQAVLTSIPRGIWSNTFSPALINNVDSAAQMGTGQGAWTSGLSVLKVYNATTFLAEIPDPVSKSQSPSEFVFAGDVVGYDVVDMPAIYVNGSCREVYAPALVDDSDQTLKDWCTHKGWGKYFSSTTLWSSTGVRLTIRWCSDYYANSTVNLEWINEAPFSSASIIVRMNGTDTKTALDGFIQCDSTFATGRTDVHGLRQSFTNFRQHAFFNTTTPHKGIPYHPLYAALFSITETFGGSTELGSDDTNVDADAERVDSILRMLGYEARYDPVTGDILYNQSSIAHIAEHLWAGATHMGAAIGLLSRDTLLFNKAIEHPIVSGRIRDNTFAALAAAVLGIWLTSLTYCTLRMYRPTFGGSLNAYSAARLLADCPHLVEGHCCGDLDDNHKLHASFGHVADIMPDEAVGHVGVAKGNISGRLVSQRLYRGSQRVLPA